MSQLIEQSMLLLKSQNFSASPTIESVAESFETFTPEMDSAWSVWNTNDIFTMNRSLLPPGNCSQWLEQLKQNGTDIVDGFTQLIAPFHFNSAGQSSGTASLVNWLAPCEGGYNSTSAGILDSLNFSNNETNDFLNENDLHIFMERPDDMLHPVRINPAFYPIVITHTLTFLIGVIGNCVVIATWAIQGKFRSPTTVFLVSLSLADLFLLLFSVPLETLEYFMITSSQNRAVCKLTNFVETISAMSTVLNLVAVSIERFLVIVYPMRARSWCTMSSTRIGLVIIWTLALLLATPTVLTRDISPLTYYNQTHSVTLYYCFDPDTQLTLAVSVYQLLVMFILPAIFMVVCYYVVIKQLWASTRSVNAMTQAEKEEVTNWKAQQPEGMLNSRPSSDSHSPLPVRARSLLSRICGWFLREPVRVWRRNSARRAKNRTGSERLRRSFSQQNNHSTVVNSSFRSNLRQNRPTTTNRPRIEWQSEESVRVRTPTGLLNNVGSSLCAFCCCECSQEAEKRHTEVSECTVTTTFPAGSLSTGQCSSNAHGQTCSSRNSVANSDNFRTTTTPLMDENVETGCGENCATQWQLEIQLGASRRNSFSLPADESLDNGPTNANNGNGYYPQPPLDTMNSNSRMSEHEQENGVVSCRTRNPNMTMPGQGVVALTTTPTTTTTPTVSSSTHQRTTSTHNNTTTYNSRTLANNVMEITKSRIQVIKMLVLIVALFLLCWGPRLIMNLLLKLRLNNFNNTTYSFRIVCNLLSFVHSALNPFVYGFMSSKFRAMVCSSFRCSKRKVHNQRQQRPHRGAQRGERHLELNTHQNSNRNAIEMATIEKY